MKNKDFFLYMTGVTLCFLLIVQPVSAAELTWHSSIKDGGSWKWEVSNYSGEIVTYFGPIFKDIEEGMMIEVKATGNPPTVGDADTIIGSTSIAWAEIYVNDTKVTGNENAIYFFVSPVDIGNGTEGWEYWVVAIYFVTAWFGGTNFEKSNSTSGNLKTYVCSNSGGTGSSAFAIDHEITYNTDTGLLDSYTYDFSNTSLASSVTFTYKSDGGLLDSIPGFDILAVTAGLTIVTLVLIFNRQKK